MKRVNNIYKDICDIDNIMYCEHIVSLHTKNKRKVERYQEYYSQNIYKIKDMLESKSYIPGRYNIFFIHEPKLRLIMSQDIEDKIINTLVAKYFLVDVFDRTFIDTTVATRVNKGTHLGLRVTKKYINDMKRKYGDNFYYLKFDINKYFHNIDHDIVKSMIRRKIKDRDALCLLDRIIDSTNCDYINDEIVSLKRKEIDRIKGLSINDGDKDIKIREVMDIPLCRYNKAFPIGSMCSQIIAIMYLDGLNHFIKEHLGIKNYIIYMDDGVLFHHDKDYLRYALGEISKYLESLSLRLNVKKTRVDRITNGLDFLGFRFLIINNRIIMKVRGGTKTRYKKRVKGINHLYSRGLISKRDVDMSLASYNNHLHYGDSSYLIYSVRNRFIK